MSALFVAKSYFALIHVLLHSHNPRRLMDEIWEKKGLRDTYLTIWNEQIPDDIMDELKSTMRADSETITYELRRLGCLAK